jgi:hypothetical protein
MTMSTGARALAIIHIRVTPGISEVNRLRLAETLIAGGVSLNKGRDDGGGEFREGGTGE